MRTFILILLLVSVPILSQSHNWISIGPDTVAVNNVLTSYSANVLLVSDGILVSDYQGWSKYSKSNLPVWDVIEIFPDTLILVMGNGGRSDGIYRFVIGDSQFVLLGGGVNPHFIVKNPYNNYYYVGSEWGLQKSLNGIEWEEVDFFKNKNCLSMDFFDEYCVISVISDTSGIYYSDDGGKNWLFSLNISYHLTNLCFDNSGLLYGIFPDESWSSGLWKSEDYGANWEVEFWATNISSIGLTVDKLFVSWHESDYDKKGVAIWDTLNREFTFLNEGLANTSIRNIVEDQFVDCSNITVCTDSGAYYLVEFPTGLNNQNITPLSFSLTNYPNPFNPKTIINYKLLITNYVELTVYNALGQKIQTLVNKKQAAGNHSVKFNAGGLSSGIYFYRITTSGNSETKKMLYLK